VLKGSSNYIERYRKPGKTLRPGHRISVVNSPQSTNSERRSVEGFAEREGLTLSSAGFLLGDYLFRS
jgi:hypothetical protein